MRNFLILLKYNFLSLIGSLQGKKKRHKTLSVLALIVLGYLAIFALSYFQGSAIFEQLSAYNFCNYGLFLGVALSFVITIVFSTMEMITPTKSTEIENLLAMPLKKSQIALSKAVYKYLFNLAITALVLLPYLINYFVFTSFSIAIFLRGFALMLLLPLLGIGLSFFFNYIISNLLNRFKFANIFKLTLSMIIMLGVLVIYFVFVGAISNLESGSINESMTNVFVIGWLYEFVLTGEILSFVWTALICFIPFAIGIWLYSISLGKSYLGYTNKSTIYDFSYNSVFKSWVKKEFKVYFGTPIYFLNTFIGPLFLIIIAGIVPIFGADKITELIGGGMGLDSNSLFLMINLIIGFMIAMTSISCSTISLEGKSLWLIKSLPIKESQVFFAKIMPNLAFVSIPAFLCSLSIALTLPFGIIETVVIFILPQLLSVFVSFGGLLFNLFLPKLDWESEVTPVKRGFSVLASMMSTMLLVILLPIILTQVGVSTTLAFLVNMVLVAFANVIVISLLFTKGKKLFAKL